MSNQQDNFDTWGPIAAGVCALFLCVLASLLVVSIRLDDPHFRTPLAPSEPPTMVATSTNTATILPRPTETATETPSATASETPIATLTNTPSATASQTPIPVYTMIIWPTPTPIVPRTPRRTR